MKKSITYIVSGVDRWQSFEWMANELRHDFDLSFVLLGSRGSFFESFLQKMGFRVFFVPYKSKKSIPLAFLRVAAALAQLKPSVVHAHFLDASIVGLGAAFVCRVPKRIYTRHHSIFHHRFKPKGVWYDRLCNHLATDIIAISGLVKRVLEEKEQVLERKVTVIHHGFDLRVFNGIRTGLSDQFLDKNRLNGKAPIVGVISRYIEWKGIQFIIPAFRDLLQIFPDACLVILNSKGPYESVIKAQLMTIPKDAVREIPFEKDIQSVYPVFDVFVHAPIDPEVEAFGQVYVEALASGTPSIFTMSGIASDFVRYEENALVVTYQSSEAISIAMKRILEDKILNQRLRLNGPKSITPAFSLDRMIEKLKCLYDR